MEPKNKLLIVDDDKAFCKLLQNIFEEEYDLVAFSDPQEAVSYLKENRVDVVLTDLMMPKISGMQILQIVKTSSFDTDVVIMTAFAAVETAIEAMKKGAHDYLIKPVRPDVLSLHLKNVFEKRRLFSENVSLNNIIDTKYRPEGMIGESYEMREVYRLIELLSQKDASVLITGESGTGKELVAKALHFSGSRKGKKFVAINCAAMPEGLLESELFGYTKGAFTGAGSNKKGLFEHAEGGTIFLDEIAEAPLSIQAKLLRVLQEKNVRPIGYSGEIPIDVRVVCATNKDLRKLMHEDKFREDLYYRINVVSVHLPSLRERKGDIPFLINHFVGNRKRIHPQAVELLCTHDWPGNVRELRNVIEILITTTDAEIITPADLPSNIYAHSLIDDTSLSYSEARQKAIDDFNRAIISKSLIRNHGNVTRVAEALRIDRGNLQRLMRKYRIVSKEFKENLGLNTSE